MFWFAASIIAAGVIAYFVITTTLEEWCAKKDREHIPTLRNIAESKCIERANRSTFFRIVPAPPYDWAREQSQSIGTALESVDSPGETVTVLLNEEGLGTALESLAMESRQSQRERVDR